jgi:hypothetical protein
MRRLNEYLEKNVHEIGRTLKEEFDEYNELLLFHNIKTKRKRITYDIFEMVLRND